MATYPWGTRDDETAEINEGWVLLGWHDLGGWRKDVLLTDEELAAVTRGECQIGQCEHAPRLTRDEFEQMWAAKGLQQGVESLVDDDDDTRALFCRAEDLEGVLATIRR